MRKHNKPRPRVARRGIAPSRGFSELQGRKNTLYLKNVTDDSLVFDQHVEDEQELNSCRQHNGND